MEALLTGLGIALSPWALLYTLVGVVLGIAVGAIPGMTGAMLITLTLPLTYHMDSNMALILLVAMYVGSVSGGLITATLFRIPGTPAAVMTTFDGYPMARAGRPGRALGLGITASFVGGIVSWLFLITLSPPLARFALQFSHFEYFAMVLMAMVLIATVSQGSLTKGLLSGLLGILVALPGIDPTTAKLRLDFGVPQMAAGFDLLPVLIGVFAISQLLGDVMALGGRIERVPLKLAGLLPSLADLRRQAVNLARSSVLGTWIGILPGIGANIGSIVAYTAAKNASRTPERFGSGSEEGITASESANNATIGGALIPLITLGIPGSVIDAILLGALILHDLQPGPMLFRNEPDLVYGIMGAALVANVMMFAVMCGAAMFFAKLVEVPRPILIPVILLFCVVGAFALHNRMFDVWVMLGFGLVGFGLERARVPLAPFVIGLVLAPVAETSLRSGLMASGGSLAPLVTRPISLLFVLVAAATLIWPLARRWRARLREA